MQSTSEEYLTGLNPSQLAGVLATHGPVLVIAGAGSGKTKMLTSRIVHLIHHHHVEARNILAVTFTNKAAAEMRERASKALGFSPEALTPSPFYSGAPQAMSLAIGTFHSICTRILRREIEHTPFKQQFVIYDDSDQLSLIKDCFSQLNISDKSFSPKSFQYAINQAKCSALEPHELEIQDFNLFSKNLSKVYSLYQTELFKNNAIDFGEIITLTYRLLRDNPAVLKKYQELYQFIHVDEYQDTNRAQYLLIKLLASGHRNLCVVGDEDQSIYKWRGADIKNILDFEKDYPESQMIKLEQNYRSTQTIINASSELISNNTSRKAKTLWTENPEGEKIKRFQLSDDRTEAELVVANIKNECAENGFSFSDVAVFYRTNAQSRVLEDVLRRERVPYKIVGGLRFYDRKEIKDVLAYFRVLTNPNDSISFKRIINVPQRAIGKATVEKIEEYSFAQKITFEQAARLIEPDKLSSGPKKKVLEFLSLLEDLRRSLQQKSLSEFYHEMMDRTRYVEELRVENTEESLSRIENLQEFDSILVEFESMHKGASGQNEDQQVAATGDLLLPLFLENVTLVGEQATAADDPSANLPNISMMTLHTSKGLEFPLVFMVGLEEGLFPSIRGNENETEEDIEEERRLCYVGMTRAKKKLYMTHAVCRRVYGNILYHEPARFFDEISDKFIEYKDMTKNFAARSMPASNSGYGSTSRNFYENDFNQSPSATGDARIGIRVKHTTYGMGIIRGVEGSDQNAKVTIEFSGKVLKKFVLKFANLEYL